MHSENMDGANWLLDLRLKLLRHKIEDIGCLYGKLWSGGAKSKKWKLSQRHENRTVPSHWPTDSVCKKSRPPRSKPALRHQGAKLTPGTRPNEHKWKIMTDFYLLVDSFVIDQQPKAGGQWISIDRRNLRLPQLKACFCCFSGHYFSDIFWHEILFYNDLL